MWWDEHMLYMPSLSPTFITYYKTQGYPRRNRRDEEAIQQNPETHGSKGSTKSKEQPSAQASNQQSQEEPAPRQGS